MNTLQRFFILQHSLLLKSMLSALAVFIWLSALMGSTPASAGYYFTGHIQNWASGTCIDGNFRGELYTLPCQHGNGWQIWEIRNFNQRGPHNHDNVEIKSSVTRACIANIFNESRPAKSDPSCSLWGGVWHYMWEANGNHWGDFNILSNNSFYGGIGNPELWEDARGWGGPMYRCLDQANQFFLQTKQCNYGRYQTWRLWG